MHDYRRRRDALAQQCAGGLVLVRGSGSEGVNPNLFYLTGIDEPGAALLLASDGVRVGGGRGHAGPDYVRGQVARQIVFLPSPDPLAAVWGEGARHTTDSVDAGEAEVDVVLPAAALDAVLGKALAEGASALHVVRGHRPSLAGDDDPDTRFAQRVGRRFFSLALRDATPHVDAMRRVKDDAEIEAVERAALVAADAFAAVGAALRSGGPANEREIDGEIQRVYRAAGAADAFGSIVACGRNACVLHYRDNSGPLEKGRLLLVDSGARIDGYCSDVTRTFPVGGRFDERQREVYDVVLAAQREAIACCRPGKTLSDVHEAAWRVIDGAGFGAAFLHGTSHHLGLEVHDVGDVHAPLEPGAVVTVEPGIYLPDESLGVRIEDDVLVAEGEPRVLTESIPKEPVDVERLVT